MAIIDKLLNKLTLKKIGGYMRFRDDPEMRMVLADMCRAHGVFDGGFDSDPYVNAFSSGERNAVLRILTIISLTPNEVLELAKEE